MGCVRLALLCANSTTSIAHVVPFSHARLPLRTRIAGRLDTGYCVLQSRVRHIGLRTLAKSAGCSRDDDVLRVVTTVPHVYVFSRTIVAAVHCHHTLSCTRSCPRLPELIGLNHYVHAAYPPPTTIIVAIRL